MDFDHLQCDRPLFLYIATSFFALFLRSNHFVFAFAVVNGGPWLKLLVVAVMSFHLPSTMGFVLLLEKL